MCAPICGDGLVIGSEQCDDGGTAAGDGCSPTCTVEPGFSCMGDPSNCVEICGDALVVGGEGCDDGNVGAGDGCAAACTVETGWTCAGEPSLCAPICGDGLVVGTEGCDEGGLNGSPAGCCAATCEAEGRRELVRRRRNLHGKRHLQRRQRLRRRRGAELRRRRHLHGRLVSRRHGVPARHRAARRFACDDGNACSSGDVCAAGICAGITGADTDGDGYCDADENARGCNPNDAAEIPPQPPVFGGIPVNGAANFLVTWVVPTSRGVVKASDPSCASVGVCGAGGFCYGGQDRRPVYGRCRLQPGGEHVSRRRELCRRAGPDRAPAVPHQSDTRSGVRAADRRLHAEGRRGARSGAPHETSSRSR